MGTSRRYNPWLHLASTTGFGLSGAIVAACFVHDTAWTDWLVIPLTFVIANGTEWRAHKDLLHRRVKPFQELYDRHTPEHHVRFTHANMAIDSWQDLKLVLIPAVGVLGIVIAEAPIAYLLGRFWSINAGWLMVASTGIYAMGYELSHLSYHLPPESFIGRLWLVRVLREHHSRHHDPRLMQKWNFNVTIPLFDWIHGTIAPDQPPAPTPR